MADQEETKPTETKVEETPPAEDKKEEPAKAAEEEKPKEEKKEEPKEEESTATFEPVVSYAQYDCVYCVWYTAGYILRKYQFNGVYVALLGGECVVPREADKHQQLISQPIILWCIHGLLGVWWN